MDYIIDHQQEKLSVYSFLNVAYVQERHLKLLEILCMIIWTLLIYMCIAILFSFPYSNESNEQQAPCI